MKKIINQIILLILCFSLFPLTAFSADDDETHGTGALKMSEEQRKTLLDSLPQITKVKYNELAISRINAERKTADIRSNSDLIPVELGTEVITDQDQDPDGDIQLFSSDESAPPQKVDNSMLNSFPEIGNQNKTNSCVAWSFGYYQMTNNISLVRGYNVKNNKDANKYIMSPLWAYNLLNNGVDNGASLNEMFNIACSYGVPSWDTCYGATYQSSDFKTWHPGADIWNNAMENKMKRVDYVTLENLTNVKKLLSDGYVVSFWTDMDGWKVTSTISSSEAICTSIHDSYGGIGHVMTIVGYDDTITTRVNGSNSGIATGAFKIANSWGTGLWKDTNGRTINNNKGYIWLSYDALKGRSDLQNANNASTRISTTEAYFLEPRVSYSPILSAEVTLNTKVRNQLAIQIGISSINTTSPQKILRVSGYDYLKNGFEESDNNYIPFYYGGERSYNFSGKTTATDATFEFDLTPIVKEYMDNLSDNTPYRFYIIVDDNNNDGNSNILKDFKLVDKKNNQIINSTCSFPLAADGSAVSAYADYELTSKIVSKDINFNLHFNYPIKSSTMTSSTLGVKDVNNKLVEGTTISAENDRKTWHLSAPSTGYTENEFYTFFVKPMMKTDGDNSLSKGEEIEFYVLQ